MKRPTFMHRPTRIDDLSADELYADLEENWQSKADRLQVRRWRKLRREIKGVTTDDRHY